MLPLSHWGLGVLLQRGLGGGLHGPAAACWCPGKMGAQVGWLRRSGCSGCLCSLPHVAVLAGVHG